MIWSLFINYFVGVVDGGEAMPSFFYSFMDNILAGLLFLPFFSFLALFIYSKATQNSLYSFALFSSGISLLLSLVLWGIFNSNAGGFSFVLNISFIPSFGASFKVGVDGISLFFIVLTNLFIYLCILSLSPATPKLSEALINLFLLQWGVLASFLVLDLFGFFLFFEITLIPIYFLVLVWGSRERRIRASYMISLYTLLGSVFMFFSLLYVYSKTGITDYEALLSIVFNPEEQKFLWIMLFIAFAAKVPLFPLHIWLPEAHVEAPTIGSVLLAALLLKLGTYGIVRFSLALFPVGTQYFGPLVSTFAVMGVIYTCLTAIRQIDLKKIIAYSSVGHMNVVLLGLVSGTVEGLEGGLFQMLSHGIVSGALFFGVGSMYERYGVRSLKYYGGLAHFYPLLTMIFLIFSLANIGFPLTSSFVGEFLIFVGLFQQSFWATFFAATSMVLGTVYTLWTFNRIFFGNVRSVAVLASHDINFKEGILYSLLLICLFVLGLAPSYVLNFMHVDCMNLLEQASFLNFKCS